MLTDKKTGFSFVMSQSQPSVGEMQKPANDEQNILPVENLKICSPMVSQGQATSITSSSFSTPVSTTSTGSIFGAFMTDNPFNLNAGKNMFGGTSKKGSQGLIKPSSFNVSANNPESIFSNSYNLQPKTATSTTTTATTVFGTNAPIFGCPVIETSSETTTNNSSPFVTNTTTTCLFGASVKPTNTVFDNTSSSFPFNSLFGACTNESPFGISNTKVTNISETKTSENEPQKEGGISFLPAADVSFSALAAKTPQQTFKIGIAF